MKKMCSTLATLLLLSSCGSDSNNDTANKSVSDPQEGDSSSDACARWCSKLESCSSDTDESDCVDACAADTGTSPDALKIIADCADSLSCNELADDEFGDCVRDDLRQIPPGQAREDFCSNFADKADACDDRTDEAQLREDCKSLIAVYSEAYVAASAQCLSRACDRVDSCFDEVGDDFNVEDGITFEGNDPIDLDRDDSDEGGGSAGGSGSSSGGGSGSSSGGSGGSSTGGSTAVSGILCTAKGGRHERNRPWTRT